MTDWDPMSGEPFPKPAWVPRKLRDAQYWWDLTCWQRNEISRLEADVVMLNEACHHRWVRADEFLARAETAEAERDDLRREGDWKANQAWARCSHAHKAAEAAEARIAAVLAMHVRTIDPWDCDSCERFWPCPTVQALLP